MSPWRTIYGQLSPAGPSARLSVLIFHRVLPVTDPLFPEVPDVRRFNEICGWLARWFRVMPLQDAVMALRGGRLPSRAAAITFDDGYADNHDCAMPVLRQHRLPATFFIATGFLDGGRMWNDTLIEAVRLAKVDALDLSGLPLAIRPALPVGSVEQKRQAVMALIRATKYLEPAERQQLVDRIAERSGAILPRDLMLRSEQVLAMRRGGMEIGAHTHTHPILTTLSRDAARQEIQESRSRLQSLLGESVSTFAYPNGQPSVDYSAQSVDVVRELGFEVAVSTAWGSAGQDVDPLQVPRFSPWDRSAWRFALRLATNLRRDGDALPRAEAVA